MKAVLSVWCLVLSAMAGFAEPVMTDTTTNAVVQVAMTNEVHQCEAITLSGNRCKRRAIPGGKCCRQHEKIIEKKKKAQP